MSAEKSITQQLAAWAVQQRATGLKPETAHQAGMATLDLLGVILGGFNVPSAQIVRTLVGQQGGAPDCTVIGTSTMVPATEAALANGTAGHALDMDDGHRLAAGHPGVTLIPAALAAAELSGASGAAFQTAVAVGYEVFVRVASAMNPSHLNRGFHTTGTIGPLGAAMAAGLLLDLNEQQLTHALGAAACSASGLFQVLNEGAMFKPIHAGRAAQAGIFAALYARAGGEAPRLALEGTDGMLRAYADDVDAQSITADLGTPEMILGLYVKLHSACRHVHAAIDAGIDLFQTRGVDPEDVDHIDVETYEVADRMTGHKYDVADLPSARFSLPFSLALAAYRGAAGPAEFVDETLNDSILQGFARKVVVSEASDLTALYPKERGARVAVHLNDSSVENACVMFPRGEPENPASHDDFQSKFRSNALETLGAADLPRIVDAVSHLESTSIPELMAVIRSAAPDAARTLATNAAR